MAYWEFLLQKEGDRSWLPLESPNVEILEGRYRVVARSSRTNTNVELRVTHISTEEVPPKRRVQKRSHQTNGEGLMVVFPFTRLKPGIWEISCVGDVMADLLGQGWEYAVSLQVLSHQQEVEDDWEPDWETTGASTPGASTADAAPMLPEVSLPSAPIPTNPVRATVVEEIDLAITAVEEVELPEVTPDTVAPLEFSPAANPDSLPAIATSQDLAATLLEDAWDAADGLDEPSPIQAETLAAVDSGAASPSDASPIANWTFQLTLDQANFIAAWGELFTLVGQIEVQGTEPGSPSPLKSWQSELQVCLRDPQTLQVMGSFCQPITVTPPTTEFSCAVEIPLDCQTRLLLGELSLYSLGEFDEASLTPLVLQTFTISAALDELLETLPDLGKTKPGDLLQALEPNLELYASPLGDPTDATDLSQLSLVFLDLLKAPKQSSPLQFQPSESQPLPPQIYRPITAEPLAKSPQLPTFRTAAENPPPPTVEDLETTEPVIDSSEGLPDQEPATVELEPLAGELQLEPEPTLPTANLEPLPQETPEPVPLEGGMTFQSLRLQERFWSRLSAIATDAELSAWLKADSSNQEPEVEIPDLFTLDPLPPAPADDSDLIAEDFPVEPEDAWLAREIVVDDDLEEVAPLVPVQISPEVEVLSAEEEGVPTPEMEVPEGELVAGKRVIVRVKLPHATSLTHVKLWINDRQTRSLMDGPRWITDFIPNGAGVLETSTQLTVPFGSLEVQFEAIAITLRNQRESRKVSVSRSVVPPDLPTLSLDELDT